VKQELVDRYPSDSLAVIIVWSQMLTGDSEETARAAAKMFGSARVQQFYDPEHRVGNAFRRQVFPDAYDKALSSLPAGHWLRESMPQMKARYQNGPEWDIYMFFDAGIDWKEAPPPPTRFVRHAGRMIEKDGGRLSLMWVGDYSNPPVEGRLPVEMDRIATSLMHPLVHSR
jgi:hypothetical protein